MINTRGQCCLLLHHQKMARLLSMKQHAVNSRYQALAAYVSVLSIYCWAEGPFQPKADTDVNRVYKFNLIYSRQARYSSGVEQWTVV